MNKNQKISFVIGVFAILIFVVGATYAYFSIGINNTTTDSTVSGTTNKYGTASLTTNTSKLYLKFTNDEMSEDHKGTTYYANSDTAGTPLTTNPNYILATASLEDGDLPLDCEYNFKVTATVTKAITDGSDSDVKITIGSTTKTLKELVSAGTDGVIVSGKLKSLVTGTNQTISLSSTITNTTANQNGLSGNSYTVTISPYASGNTKSFSCKLQYIMKSNKTLAQNLVDSGWLWQSELEGDGYRYTGSGAVGTSTNPNNFICFGTNNKSECTANQDKYMYRVLGVFSDSDGNNHVKLIKYKQLLSAKWNDTNADVNWENSTLYASLNGAGFLTNTTYNYLQDTEWSNKIENWTWSAVNTKTYVGSNGLNYSSITTEQMYLHEMNRTGKSSTVGEWTNPVAKIGLMYASDYQMSLGSSALAITGSTSENQSTLKTSWMHQSNNDTTKSSYEWTLARMGATGSRFGAWYVNVVGAMDGNGIVNFPRGVRPVFYLTNDVKITSDGTGSLENPFIISE